MLPEPGQVVGGKYRVLRLLGEGGMGAVYEARHEVLGAGVALKFLQPALARKPELIARFMQEARVSATVQSPHVARVTDVDRLPEGSAYLVMELLVGESLQHRLDVRCPLPQDEAVDITLQILLGLETAHERGVVHRDLKPDNAFIVQTKGGGLVKLLDFGIAKLRDRSSIDESLTRPGEMMGTPEYMAPEQAIAADRVDGRADVYAAGVLLYEMLTGHRPVEASNPGEIIERAVTGQQVPVEQRDASIPASLAALINHACTPDPDRRIASAKDFRLRLSEFAGVLSHAGQVAALANPTDSVLPWAPSVLPPSVMSAMAPRALSPSAMAHAAAPPAPVADTVPPMHGGMPPSVVATQIRYDAPRTTDRPAKTQSMRPPGAGRGVLAAVVLLLLVAGGVAGALVYLQIDVRRYFFEREPPPLPEALTIDPTATAPQSLVVPGSDPGERSRREPERGASPVTTAAPSPRPVEPGPSQPPGQTTPPFSLPSSFPPLPSGFPSTLPQIPGLPDLLPPMAPLPGPPSQAAPAPAPAQPGPGPSSSAP